MVGRQVAVLEGFEIILHPAKVEEQLLLRRGGDHFDQAPRAEDEFLDRGADPPHRIGREAEAAFGIELLHALHQSVIAFRSEEHTSELQSLMRNSYAVFCLKITSPPTNSDN